MEDSVGDVTRLLNQLKSGNRLAEDELIPIVYDKLKKLAASQLRREHPDHSMQTTDLVHEAYLRLTRMQEIDWQSRSHFFRISALVMRRILVDQARARLAGKRGDGLELVSFDEAIAFTLQRPKDLVALDEALNRLAGIDPRATQIVELRFFGGMTEEEIGLALDISPRTVKRDWHSARLWLFDELTRKPDSGKSSLNA